MLVSQLMIKNVVTCHRDDNLDDVARLMWNHDIGFLPVVDDDRHVIGVVTDRDACMAAFTNHAPLHEIPVHVAMSRTVVSCAPEEFADDAEHRFAKHQVRRMPVLDHDGRLLGVFTLGDVAHAALCVREIPLRGIASTFATITMPRPHALEQH